jgi:hypothetical protein
MPPPPPRQRSRPDARRDDDDTPPSGTEYRDELARAIREPMPWWAALLMRKLDVDEWLRQRDQRIGAVEGRVDEIEDANSNTKVNAREAEKEQKKRREKRADRLWTLAIAVLGPLLVLAILTAVGWVHFGQPAHPTPIEVKP